MNTIKVSKAKYGEDFQIQISESLPPFMDEAGKAIELFEFEAAEIVNAMQSSLPGGALDAILRELLRKRASLLQTQSNKQGFN